MPRGRHPDACDARRSGPEGRSLKFLHSYQPHAPTVVCWEPFDDISRNEDFFFRLLLFLISWTTVLTTVKMRAFQDYCIDDSELSRTTVCFTVGFKSSFLS
jgi:hypothetical protein